MLVNDLLFMQEKSGRKGDAGEIEADRGIGKARWKKREICNDEEKRKEKKV